MHYSGFKWSSVHAPKYALLITAVCRHVPIAYCRLCAQTAVRMAWTRISMDSGGVCVGVGIATVLDVAP